MQPSIFVNWVATESRKGVPAASAWTVFGQEGVATRTRSFLTRAGWFAMLYG